MSGFSGINNFGSLTTTSGQKLTFKDFDVNSDGKVTKEEYDKVLKEMDLDKVDLSTNDKNKDNVLSEDEFATGNKKLRCRMQLMLWQDKLLKILPATHPV